ncbi:MAG: hypothetical protein R3A13_02545 [Bdellovibrionota bacterium]
MAAGNETAANTQIDSSAAKFLEPDEAEGLRSKSKASKPPFIKKLARLNMIPKIAEKLLDDLGELRFNQSSIC